MCIEEQKFEERRGGDGKRAVCTVVFNEKDEFGVVIRNLLKIKLTFMPA